MATIARTLGLFDGVERPAAEALPSFLADRSMLLVLDNFEHLLDAAGEVAALVRMSPASRIVVTSRAPLHLGGEQEYPVRPLTIGARCGRRRSGLDAAPQLFVDRARAVRPDWEPGPDMPIVVEICALLDGLPLGIELAAARVVVAPARRRSATGWQPGCLCLGRGRATLRPANARWRARSAGATTS